MDNTLKIAICEDHMIERTILQLYIGEFFNGKRVETSVAEYESGSRFLASDYSDLDLAFLDIYMDDIDGISTARKIAETNKKVRFVFCSASPEFIDQVDDLNVLRYFIKPLSPNKFNEAMEAFMKERN